MIKDMVKEHLNGQMGDSTREVGSEANNTDLVYIQIKQEKVGKENGTKGRGFVGSIDQNIMCKMKYYKTRYI